MEIDKHSPMPLYYQLKEIIREGIEGGVWGPGDCLPAEKEFCDQYDLSRATVRQALADLERYGLVERRQGKGTFVRGPKVEEDLLGFYSFSREMRAKGLHPSSRTVSIDRVPAVGRLAQLFDLGEDEPVLRVVRLRLLENEPLFIEKTYLPASHESLLQEEELSTNAPVFLNLLTQKLGFSPDKVKKYIEPAVLDNFEAHLLQVSNGSPALILERITYDGERALAVCTWIVRGDRCRHYLNLKLA